MKHILIFPGQGYQNKKMLNLYVINYCIENGLYTILDDVLNDDSKLFDTKYAQPLIVATQLAESQRYVQSLNPEDEVIYMGFSLGEITALIAAKAMEQKEGIEFVKTRGVMSKKFSEEILKSKYGVAKLPYSKELENKIKEWNENNPTSESISITNFMPSTRINGNQDVTITGKFETIQNNIEFFGGSKEQKIGKMQCPFHTQLLEKLASSQLKFFNRTISQIDEKNIEKVICTRTGKKYNSINIEELSESLAKYLVEPMQTTESLQYIKENYPDDKIVVFMGEGFAKNMKRQYEALGGNADQITFFDSETGIDKSNKEPEK